MSMTTPKASLAAAGVVSCEWIVFTEIDLAVNNCQSMSQLAIEFNQANRQCDAAQYTYT